MVNIGIHSVPRSGSTWLGEIFNSSPFTLYKFQPLFSYDLKDYLTISSSKGDVELFFRDLGQTSSEFLDKTKKRRDGSLPLFEKSIQTHLVYKEVRYINILPNILRQSNKVLFIFLIRNPLSVINSWLRAPREFRKDLGWNPHEEWRYALKKNLNKPEEYNGYEKWKEAALIFRHLAKIYPEQVRIVEYNKLVNEPVETVSTLFEFVDLPTSESTIEFIKMSQSKSSDDAYSVFRANQTDCAWKKELDPAIVESIVTDLENSELACYLE